MNSTPGSKVRRQKRKVSVLYASKVIDSSNEAKVIPELQTVPNLHQTSDVNPAEIASKLTTLGSIPKKSKRNKYYHLTEAYKQLCNTSTCSSNITVGKFGISQSSKHDLDLPVKSPHIGGQNRRLSKHKHPQPDGKYEVPKDQKRKKLFKKHLREKKARSLQSEIVPTDGGGSMKLHAKHHKDLEHASVPKQANFNGSHSELSHEEHHSNIDLYKERKNRKAISSSTENMGLLSKLASRLSGSHFRFINEQLYSMSGTDALQMFTEDNSLFTVYHDGYQRQVSLWPINPLDVIINQLNNLSKSMVVADFGCGTARLATSVKQKVHSFDLVAVDDQVTACDMAKVPLENGCVDVAVFCLSLMGTTVADYLREANRVLKPNGLLKIAEVRSRIPKIYRFTKTLSRLGFTLQETDSSGKMFIFFDFIKTSAPKATQLQFTLLPCVYKPR